MCNVHSMPGEQFNFRLDEKYSNKLKKVADEKETKPSSLAADIVKKSLDFWEKKRERGEITQARFVIAKYMNILDASKIDECTEDIASYILGEMKIQVGKLDYEEFEKRLLKWNKENNIEFAKFEELDSIIYLSKHDLGRNWSELQCKIYIAMLKKMDKIVLENELDNAMFSITISNPN